MTTANESTSPKATPTSNFTNGTSTRVSDLQKREAEYARIRLKLADLERQDLARLDELESLWHSTYVAAPMIGEPTRYDTWVDQLTALCDKFASDDLRDVITNLPPPAATRDAVALSILKEGLTNGRTGIEAVICKLADANDREWMQVFNRFELWNQIRQLIKAKQEAERDKIRAGLPQPKKTKVTEPAPCGSDTTGRNESENDHPATDADRLRAAEAALGMPESQVASLFELICKPFLTGRRGSKTFTYQELGDADLRWKGGDPDDDAITRAAKKLQSFLRKHRNLGLVLEVRASRRLVLITRDDQSD
ncbi:MAG: hypothetical protein U0939_22815 [Pirellulales bacterium]